MKFKKFLSVLLALSLVVSCMTVAGTVFASGAEADAADTAAAGSAYSEMLAQTSSEGYGLSSTVNQGAILQAWSWSFANIEANLETIAEQGFTTVQVSPPNEIKKGTAGAKFLQSDNQNGWWMFYQPAGFQLNNSTDNALGTKAQFISMCNKAHELGVKVIVDAVINHMGTKEGDDSNTSTDPMSHVTPKAQTFEPEIYNNKLFHSPWKKMEYIEQDNTYYNSAYDLTRNCTSGLPDLKTEDQRVQNAIYDYLEELVQAGADGFRFDAAKHIETPDDHDGLGSDFWTDTLVKVQNQHPEKEIYAYGEILNTCGISRPFSWYTKLFDVTDSSYYWNIKDAAVSGGGNATPFYPNTNFTSSNTMLWDESHDTYIDGATTSLTTAQRGKIWALVAGRQDISCVYLARPSDDTNTNALYNITLGTANKTSWSNATTKAINQFHNYFIGQPEYCTANSGGTACIERGSTGAMIVTLGGTYGKSVTLANHKLTPGTYKDSVTGNEFTVTSSQIKGTVGNTGVACIYENNYVAPTEPPVLYMLGDADGNEAVESIDATVILRYTVDLAELDEIQTLAADVDGDGLVTVLDATFIQRYLAEMTVKYDIGQMKDANEKPVTPTTAPYNPTTPVYPTTPVNPTTHVEPTTYVEPTYSGDGATLYFTNNKGWSSVNAYVWNGDTNAEIAAWPGTAATYVGKNDYSEDIYSVYVPAEYDMVIFNGDGQTRDITVSEAVAGGCGIYCLDSMVGTGYDVGFYTYVGPTPPVDPTTHVEPTTYVEPTYSGDGATLYFTNNKGWSSVNAYVWNGNTNAEVAAWPGSAATLVGQNDFGENIYSVYVPAEYDMVIFNGNGQTRDITISEAVAGGCGIYCLDTMVGTGYDVGFYTYVGPTPPVDPTDPPVNPTDPPVQPTYSGEGTTLYFTNNKGWSSVNAYVWNGNTNAEVAAWPGSAATLVGQNDFGESIYSVYIPAEYDMVIFNGNGQTRDITVSEAVAGGCGIYCLDTMVGTGYDVGFYTYVGPTPPVDPTNPPVQPTEHHDVGEDVTLYFSNNKGWSNVNAYVWNTTTGAKNAEWPGLSATLVGKNSIGEDVYSVSINTGTYDMVIFNGTGGQTDDISVAAAVAAGCGLYCLDTQTNNKFDVGYYEYTGLGGGDTEPTQGGDTPQPGNKIYLNPGSNWPQDGARYAAYFFGNGETWLDVTSDGSSYSVTVPDGYTSVIFCRMNPATTDNNWNNKWNQTDDLTISGNIGKTYYVTGWDKSGYWG